MCVQQGAEKNTYTHLFKKELVFLRVLLLFDILFFDTLRDVVTDEGEGVRVWE